MSIETLRRKADFLQYDAPPWVHTVWPHIGGLTWFIKLHREQLLATGAVVRIGREYFIVGDEFLPIAREILGIPESPASTLAEHFGANK